LVLDALTTVKAIKWSDSGPIPFPKELDKTETKETAAEFTALHGLMVNHVWKQTERQKLSAKRCKGYWKEPMPTDAAVYVFWYSQLRELVVREPRLARLLSVRSLPGGGLRGDWYVHVEEGSVSLRLGEAIVKHMCSAAEDYERFRAGLSLPVAAVMRESGLLAWPGASPDMKVAEVETIWSNAKRRSNILLYRRFNHLLSTVGEVLAGKYLDPRDVSVTVDGVDLAERLPKLVTALCSASS
jgi:hypothetical protein